MSRNMREDSIIASVLLIALFVLLVALPIRTVAAPLTISIRPLDGVVGSTIDINGTINTENGPFTVRWNGLINISSGTAEGFNVTTSFEVPSSVGALSGRNVTVELIDDTAGSVAEVNFTLFTKLHISVEAPSPPDQLLEGTATQIKVDVTGGEENTVYTANITVKDPANQTYFTIVPLSNTTTTGEGSANRTYPEDFDLGAHTNLVGRYIAAFNETTHEFLVGLTDKPQYRIGETVQIRAAGYKSAEVVRLDIRFGAASVSGFPRNSTATTDGLVLQSWTIVPNSLLGTYIISLENATSEGTIKTPRDSQSFDVTGVVCNIHTRNIAGEDVANALVEVYNASSPSVLLVKRNTNATGWTKLNLESGFYNFRAFFKDVEVGNRSNEHITVDTNIDMQLKLVSVLATAKTEVGNKVPLIDVLLKYNFTTRENLTTSGSTAVQTDLDGIAEALNLFTNTTYVVEARRYNMLFSNTTLSIEYLPSSGWKELDITVPIYDLNIHALDSKNSNASGVRIEVYEWSAGVTAPFSSSETDDTGYARFAMPLGRYRVRAFIENTMLNETVVDLHQNQMGFTFRLITAKVNVIVSVLDVLGQPIANANVTIERKVGDRYLPAYSQFTDSGGHATFASKIGGNSRITVYMTDKLAGVTTQFLGSGTEEVTLRLGEYVVVLGYPIETGLFTLLVFMLVTLLIVLVLARDQLFKALRTKRKK